MAAIDAMGFRTISAAKWFASAKREVTLIAAGLNLFAMIALFVAGDRDHEHAGDERRRADEGDRHPPRGGRDADADPRAVPAGGDVHRAAWAACWGWRLARGLAVPADRWVWGMIEKVAEGDKLLGTTVFVFPSWLYVASVVFAVLVTTAAAYYPARRAARIHPIEALRYG